jgi:hypothetical protein
VFGPGQKLKCIDNRSVEQFLVVGMTYTCLRIEIFLGEPFVWLTETIHHQGWYPSRFKVDDISDYKHFMDRVMKPVDLREKQTT